MRSSRALREFHSARTPPVDTTSKWPSTLMRGCAIARCASAWTPLATLVALASASMSYTGTEVMSWRSANVASSICASVCQASAPIRPLVSTARVKCSHAASIIPRRSSRSARVRATVPQNATPDPTEMSRSANGRRTCRSSCARSFGPCTVAISASTVIVDNQYRSRGISAILGSCESNCSPADRRPCRIHNHASDAGQRSCSG